MGFQEFLKSRLPKALYNYYILLILTPLHFTLSLSFFGNRKRHGIPPLRELRLKRLVCFWGAQWKKLNRLIHEDLSKKRPSGKSRRRRQKKPKENIYFNILLPDVPTEEPARNIWEVLSDEEHRWGDLTREEELKVKSLLQGKEYLFKDF